jgi:hypothetical protein
MTARRSTYSYLAPNGAPPAEVARAVNEIRDGQMDVTGSLTMESGTSQTVINTERAVVMLIPMSEAAAAVAWWIDTSPTRGKVTIGHDAAGSDLDFAWIGLG